MKIRKDDIEDYTLLAVIIALLYFIVIQFI
jgi:hypothetical protein